jgi:hypothetical protein
MLLHHKQQVAQYFLADEGALPEAMREPIVEHLVLAHQVLALQLLLIFTTTLLLILLLTAAYYHRSNR